MTMAKATQVHKHKVRKTRSNDVVWLPENTTNKHVTALFFIVMQRVVNGCRQLSTATFNNTHDLTFENANHSFNKVCFYSALPCLARCPLIAVFVDRFFFADAQPDSSFIPRKVTGCTITKSPSRYADNNLSKP